ncbi:MAG TPA: flagellar basal body rod protein FlgG [Clostridiales bacterium]|nr:flagellar basal body rod protein FlgG [Clostridiales bacterium]
MMRSLFSAVSGLKSNQTAMDVIGNNIANVNTTAYKTSRTVFHDIYSQTVKSATAPTADNGGRNAQQIGLGVDISAIDMTMTEGSPQATSRPLDFSIAGEGFFVVGLGDGSYAYTRNGALELDANGYLVTANGDYVMGITGDETHVINGSPLFNTAVTPAAPLFGRIQIQGKVDTGADDPITGDPIYETYTDYAIDANGTITAMDSAGSTVTLGRLVLATFSNASGLEKIGSSYYSASPNSGAADMSFANNGCGYLNSGSLEMSNVDIATELTSMIITQRAFQANSRVITTSDTLLEELINLKR